MVLIKLACNNYSIVRIVTTCEIINLWLVFNFLILAPIQFTVVFTVIIRNHLVPGQTEHLIKSSLSPIQANFEISVKLRTKLTLQKKPKPTMLVRLFLIIKFKLLVHFTFLSFFFT